MKDRREKPLLRDGIHFNPEGQRVFTVYRIMGAPDFGQETEDFSESVTGRFDENRQEWRTTWTGDLPAGLTNRGFFFIRATRP